MQPPAQELMAKDLHGQAWTFRHIYRGMLSSGVGILSLLKYCISLFLHGPSKIIVLILDQNHLLTGLNESRV